MEDVHGLRKRRHVDGPKLAPHADANLPSSGTDGWHRAPVKGVLPSTQPCNLPCENVLGALGKALKCFLGVSPEANWLPSRKYINLDMFPQANLGLLQGGTEADQSRKRFLSRGVTFMRGVDRRWAVS